MKVPDCQSCGACCFADYAAQVGYVGLEKEDIVKLPPAFKKKVVKEPGEPSGTYLATRIDTQGNTRCCALKGKLGGPCSCAIYEQRPKVCAVFEPGSENCRAARRDAGLDETTFAQLEQCLFGRRRTGTR